MLQVDVYEKVVYDWNCPNCRHENQTEADVEVVCDRCGKQYQPIVIEGSRHLRSEGA